MARRPFRFQKVLDWKSRQEKMKRIEKSILEREVAGTNLQIARCLSEIDDLARTAFEKVGSEVMARDMRLLSGHLQNVSQTVLDLQADLKVLMSKIGNLNAEILEVRRMKKVLEKLQERFRMDEIREDLKREIKFLDQVGSRRKEPQE